ncbi:hypothetical protein [Streptomyces sp. NBC_00035]
MTKAAPPEATTSITATTATTSITSITSTHTIHPSLRRVHKPL